MENTLEIHKHLDNFRADINSFDKWNASTGEILTLQELIVTKNTFPFLRGIPISEIEKYRDLSRSRWNVTTSRTEDASATIDAYGVDINKTKVKFIDGYVSYDFPHERKEIGQAFSEFVRMLINGIRNISKSDKELEQKFKSSIKCYTDKSDEHAVRIASDVVDTWIGGCWVFHEMENLPRLKSLIAETLQNLFYAFNTPDPTIKPPEFKKITKVL